MKTAIERALGAGWKPKNHRDVWQYNPNNRTGVTKTFRASMTHNDILLDPTFWQALGKAEGWEKEPHLCKECGVIGTGTFNHMNACKTRTRSSDWITIWHRFINHIASGGDIDTFFTNLLSQRE